MRLNQAFRPVSGRGRFLVVEKAERGRTTPGSWHQMRFGMRPFWVACYHAQYHLLYQPHEIGIFVRDQPQVGRALAAVKASAGSGR